MIPLEKLPSLSICSGVPYKDDKIIVCWYCKEINMIFNSPMAKKEDKQKEDLGVWKVKHLK